MFGSDGLALLLLATCLSEPRAMVVPPALAARNSNPEPSGIAWSAKLSRYLVVSDDTGRKDEGSYHAPWVYAMTEGGVLDVDPVPIEGLDDLNDAEAITAGPAGSFFLTTSHSPNKRGRLKPGRRMLLHLGLEGRKLVVLGRADLTSARGPAGETLLEIAGVDPNGRLDIEALAFHEGALYVGLKSPLRKDGAAVVLRLGDPVAALRAGTIPAGAVERFLEVPLRVASRESAVFQGISDMTFLPDGSLCILANSPKGMPRDGGGALYWLRAPRHGSASATLVHQFAGLKPEGVSLSSDGAALVIVIDHDQAQPLWMRWPLPR